MIAAMIRINTKGFDKCMQEIGEKRMVMRRRRLVRPELVEPRLGFLLRQAGNLGLGLIGVRCHG